MGIEMGVVVKQPDEKHFTKEFGHGRNFSHRVILPGTDNCRVKMTDFTLTKGFTPGIGVVHDTDELVYVLAGAIRLLTPDLNIVLVAGGVYFVPAGAPTTIAAIEQSRLLCVFFPAEGGPLPDDN